MGPGYSWLPHTPQMLRPAARLYGPAPPRLPQDGGLPTSRPPSWGAQPPTIAGRSGGGSPSQTHVNLYPKTPGARVIPENTRGSVAPGFGYPGSWARRDLGIPGIRQHPEAVSTWDLARPESRVYSALVISGSGLIEVPGGSGQGPRVDISLVFLR